jgi:uncharacterized protein (TIGR02594 family)
MRVDVRIVVALGCVGVMLIAMPMLTRHRDIQQTPPQRAAGVQSRHVAAAPASSPAIAPAPVVSAAAREVAAKPDPEKPARAMTRFATQERATVSVPLPHARPQMSANKLVFVPLPRARPQTIATVPISPPMQVADALPRGPIADPPLPKARPQSLAVATSSAVAPIATAEATKVSQPGAIAHPPLPKARPMKLAALQPVAPLPKARPQLSPAVTTPVVATAAEPQQPTVVVTATTADQPAKTEAPAVAESAAPGSEIRIVSSPDSTVPLLNEPAFVPPIPKVRPTYIDRLVLVAEARKYMGTNPTNRSSLWCAVFMNMVLHKLGYNGTDSAAARSFADYGRRIPGPKIGAIAVLSRGADGGHVGVVSGVDRQGNPIIVSGNHGHRVGVGTYPRSRVIAYVLPTRQEFRRGHSAERTRHTSAATTTFAARSTPAEPDPNHAPKSLADFMAAMNLESRKQRPGSTSLSSRAQHSGSYQAAYARDDGVD